MSSAPPGDLERELMEVEAALSELERRPTVEEEKPLDCVFLFGAPRSGASDVAAALSQHPRLFSIGDSHLFYQWWLAKAGAVGMAVPERRSGWIGPPARTSAVAMSERLSVERPRAS